MSLTAERLQIEVGADTSEAERKLRDLGDSSGSGAWTGALKTAGVAAFTAIGAAGVAVVGTGLKIAADMEQADIAFSTMLGSGEKAKVFLDQLKAFAASTPFEFPELQKAASSLISAGFEASKVIPIMTTLGDVTSGMGTGAEGVQRATVALQQMSAAGKITGEDLNQLRDAGVPVFDLLAAATGKSKDEIAALAQAGKLGKKEMEALFKALETGKGLEKFNGLMEKQSQSLTGLLSTLKDTVGQSLAGMMGPVVGELKGALPQVTAVIDEALKAVGPSLTDLAGGVIDALKAILPSLVPILGAVAQTIGQVFSQLAPVVAELLPAFLSILQAILPVLPSLVSILVAMSPALVLVANAAAALINALPPAALVAIGAALLIAFGPITPIIAAVMGLALAASFVIDHWSAITGFFGQMWDGVKSVFSAAGDFIRVLLDNWFRILLAIVTGGQSEIFGFFVRHWSDIKNLFLGGIAAVVSFMTALPGRIVGGLASAVGALLGWFRALPGQIVSALGNLTGLLYEAGRQIVQGLINGIKAMFGAAVSAVKSVVSGAINAGKSLLGIGSPSRVFAGMGRQTMEGFILGMLGQARDVERAAMAALAPVTGMKPALLGGVGPASSLASGIGPSSAAAAGAAMSARPPITIIVEGSVWHEQDLFDMIRGRLSDLGVDLVMG